MPFQNNHSAVQYLTWALEEIEQMGRPEAARHVRKALEQLGSLSSDGKLAPEADSRQTREAKKLRAKADEADQLALHARTASRRDALAKVADCYRQTAEQIEQLPPAGKR